MYVQFCLNCFCFEGIKLTFWLNFRSFVTDFFAKLAGRRDLGLDGKKTAGQMRFDAGP